MAGLSEARLNLTFSSYHPSVPHSFVSLAITRQRPKEPFTPTESILLPSWLLTNEFWEAYLICLTF